VHLLDAIPQLVWRAASGALHRLQRLVGALLDPFRGLLHLFLLHIGS
jgi:hypothetical protein